MRQLAADEFSLWRVAQNNFAERYINLLPAKGAPSTRLSAMKQVGALRDLAADVFPVLFGLVTMPLP